MLYFCLCTSFVGCYCVLTEKIDENDNVVTIDHFSRLWVGSVLVSFGDSNVWPSGLLQATVGGDPGQNGHTPKRPHPKRPQLFWLPKRPQPKRPHCIGQNGHTGRITTKTAKLHLVKTATQGGSLPKRPHCIWSKRPQREDHYQNAFGQNGHKGRITTKTATQYNCGVAVLVATCVHSRHTN